MAKTTICCHLANIAFQSGKTIRWDATKKDLANPSDGRGCVSYEREYRRPWTLKHYRV
jgi:hypothetical protein